MHYRRLKKGKDLEAPIRVPIRGCSVEGCGGAHCARGYCAVHYGKWSTHGDALFEPEMRYIKCARQRCDETLTVGIEFCHHHLGLIASRMIPKVCTWETCDEPQHCRGYCESHYWRWQNGRDMAPPITKRIRGRVCVVPDCGKPHSSGGYCQGHALRRVRGVDLNAPFRREYENLVCRQQGCDRPTALAKESHSWGGFGYCGPHYDRWRNGQPLGPPIRVIDPMRGCKVEGCGGKHASLGYCNRHYLSITGIGRWHTRKYKARKQGGIPYTADQWNEKLAYWGNKCWMCGVSGRMEIDHVKPVSKGGIDALCNLRPACRSCNAKKNARWPIDFADPCGTDVGVPADLNACVGVAVS